MKNKFLMTLGAFVIFAVAFAIYQSKKADTPPSYSTAPAAAGIGIDAGMDSAGAPGSDASSAGASSTINNSNAKKPMSDIIAQKGDTVFVQYTGKLTDGTVFDSSIPRGQPFAFKLGSGAVIAGWEKGILGMRLGEKKTLTIPAADGYGASGVPNQAGGYIIPPNATLVFDVELVDVKR